MKPLLTAVVVLFVIAPVALALDALSIRDARVEAFASAEGGFWYAASGNVIGFIGIDGADMRVTLPFVFERRPPMLTLSDGSVVVGGLNRTIAHVRPDLTFDIVRRPERPMSSGETSDLVLGADGNVWYAGGGAFGTIRDGQPLETPLDQARSIIAGDDGWLYVVTFDAIHRVSYDGEVKASDPVAPCYHRPWAERTADGTLWTQCGYLRPGFSFQARIYGGVDATVGPYGRVWVAGDDNLLRVIDGDGDVRDLPLTTPMDRPVAIAANDGDIWYATSGSIVRVTTSFAADLHFRLGDLIVSELVPNCCFEGDYPQLSQYRPTGARFSRRVATPDSPVWAYRGGVLYAIDSTRVLVAGGITGDGPPDVVVILDGEGEPTDRIESNDALATLGLVAARNGTAYALRGFEHAVPERILTIAPDGAIVHDVAWPASARVVPRAVDLRADQCTLTYVGSPAGGQGSVIGRIDLCTATASDMVEVNPDERAHDLRILPGDELLIAYPSRIVRLDERGAELQQIDADGETRFLSIALDTDPQYIWVGTSRGLIRIRLSSGEVVERIATYGAPVRISVVGEPRASRITSRRRSVGRASCPGQAPYVTYELAIEGHYIVDLKDGVAIREEAERLAAVYGFKLSAVFESVLGGFAAEMNDRSREALRCESSVESIHQVARNIPSEERSSSRSRLTAIHRSGAPQDTRRSKVLSSDGS